MSAIERAWAGEFALLDPAVRRDRESLEAILAFDFQEVGRSGRLWSRGEVVDALIAEGGLPGEPTLSEQVGSELAPGVVLLRYRLEVDGEVSRRTSLWRVDHATRLIFHQGTDVVDAAPEED